MKKFNSNTCAFLLCIMMLALANTSMLYAQSNNNIGIGTTSPNASAILDITSTTKGLLIPRMTDGQQNSLSGPAGLLIYNTTQNRFNFYNGGWKGVNLWTANGNKAYYNDGNVGIGTGDPLAKLSISPSATEPKITLYDGLSTTDHYGFGVSAGQLNYHVIGSSDSHVFYRGGKNGNGTELMRINGNGTTRIAGNFFLNYDAPTIFLQDTDHKSGMIHQNADLMYFLSGSGVNSTSWSLNGSYWPLTLNMNNDAATFGGPAYFMEGDVGIGTSSPGYKLTIAGGGMGLDNGSTMYAKNSGGTYEPFFWPRWTDNIMYMNYGTGGFHIRNNASATTMFMTNDGNVGIGTTAPLSKLHIEGLYTTRSAPGNGWWRIGGGGGNHFTFSTEATQSGVATVNYSSGCFFCISDERLKDNINPLGTVLPSLMKLEAKRYFMKSDPEKESNIGFIAQEVEKLFPEFIMAPSVEENSDPYYKMNYAGFGIIAVKAIQEQQAIIEIQQEKIDELEAVTKSQQAELDAIKRALEQAGIDLD